MDKKTRFAVTVWEKAEHWEFETSIDAEDEAEARKIAAKDFPPRDYRIKDVRFDNTYAPNFQ